MHHVPIGSVRNFSHPDPCPHPGMFTMFAIQFNLLLFRFGNLQLTHFWSIRTSYRPECVRFFFLPYERGPSKGVNNTIRYYYVIVGVRVRSCIIIFLTAAAAVSRAKRTVFSQDVVLELYYLCIMYIYTSAVSRASRVVLVINDDVMRGRKIWRTRIIVSLRTWWSRARICSFSSGPGSSRLLLLLLGTLSFTGRSLPVITGNGGGARAFFSSRNSSISSRAVGTRAAAKGGARVTMIDSHRLYFNPLVFIPVRAVHYPRGSSRHRVPPDRRRSRCRQFVLPKVPENNMMSHVPPHHQKTSTGGKHTKKRKKKSNF